MRENLETKKSNYGDTQAHTGVTAIRLTRDLFEELLKAN